jgi:hypothetical protein
MLAWVAQDPSTNDFAIFLIRNGYRGSFSDCRVCCKNILYLNWEQILSILLALDAYNIGGLSDLSATNDYVLITIFRQDH